MAHPCSTDGGMGIQRLVSGAALTVILSITACEPTPTGREGPARFLDPEFAVVVESDIVYATGAVRLSRA